MADTVAEIGQDPALRAALLTINNLSATETSPLDAAKFACMIEAARVATVAGGGAAFLLAFDQTADYDSPNYLWFRERFERFLYIDRVIVDAAHRRFGFGRALYDDLFRRAGELAHRRIACEVNMLPPNPVSDAFHARLGFAEIGRATLSDGAKAVRYLVKAV
jgi:uncharacterized protein